MHVVRSSCGAGIFLGITLTTLNASAAELDVERLAEPAETPPPVSDTTPADEPTTPPPVVEESPPPELEPEPEATVTTTTTTTTVATPPAEEPEPEEEAPTKWYDAFNLSAFVDAYAQVNWNLPQSQTSVRGNDDRVGFALGWAGLNVGYDNGVVGGTVNLRFGPRTQRYAIFPEGTAYGGAFNDGLQYVKQAYATWKPKKADGKLAFDLGKWDTLYGSEVGDSQFNLLYSWPYLFFYGQPFYHTGFRITAQVAKPLGITLFAANGWNNTFDNNGGKTYGVQFSIVPNDKFKLVLGYVTGPEQSRTIVDENGDSIAQEDVNRRFRHFGDLIMLVTPSPKFTLILNADLGYDQIINDPLTGDYDGAVWWGATLTLGSAFSDRWRAAIRGDLIHNVSATAVTTLVEDQFLGSATLNIDFLPMPNLMIRFENRFDASNEEFFPKSSSDVSKFQGTSMLAMIVSIP